MMTNETDNRIKTNKRRDYGFTVYRLQQSSSNLSTAAGKVLLQAWHYDELSDHELIILDSYITRMEEAIVKYREDLELVQDAVTEE